MNTLATNELAKPFLYACEQLAQDFYKMHGLNPEQILKKERELASLKAELSKTRESFAEAEALINTLSGEAQANAYTRLFNFQGKRNELEEQVWALDCMLTMLKSPKFA